MGIRKEQLECGKYYHIFNKSIAKYKIFTSRKEYQHFVETLKYYLYPEPNLKISRFLELSKKNQQLIIDKRNNNDNLIEIVCFCIMPTHFHLLLKQNTDGGISDYLRNIQNSYSHYFNIKHKRNGHLWQGKFKNVLIGSEEQLLHLSRYIHLNPCTSGLVNRPEEWEYSSYTEYSNWEEKLCVYQYLFHLNSKSYQNFVNNHKEYQKQLGLIKASVLE